MRVWKSRSFALFATTVAVGLALAGCGGDDEPTTIDLTGLITIKQADTASVDAQEVQDALVSGIQSRAPSGVSVVYTGGGGGGGGGKTKTVTTGGTTQTVTNTVTQTQPGGGGGGGKPPFNICDRLPYVCDPIDLSDLLDQAYEETLPGGTKLPPGILGEVDIAGVKARTLVGTNGKVTAEIEDLPSGAAPPKDGGGVKTETDETTETETTPDAGDETGPAAPQAPEGAPQEPQAPQAPQAPSGGETPGQ